MVGRFAFRRTSCRLFAGRDTRSLQSGHGRSHSTTRSNTHSGRTLSLDSGRAVLSIHAATDIRLSERHGITVHIADPRVRLPQPGCRSCTTSETDLHEAHYHSCSSGAHQPHGISRFSCRYRQYLPKHIPTRHINCSQRSERVDVSTAYLVFWDAGHVHLEWCGFPPPHQCRRSVTTANIQMDIPCANALVRDHTLYQSKAAGPAMET